MINTQRSHLANITVTDFDGRPWVEVKFQHEQIPAWTISLCLLEAGLIESLKLSSEQPPVTLQLAVAGNLPEGDRAQALWHEAGLALTLSTTELSYWTAFFLKYCRDNMGEVDHIDCEVRGPHGLDLTLAVPYAQPPLSPEELKRQLGALQSSQAQ